MKKITNFGLILFFIAIVFGFSIAFVVTEDNEFSAEENRTLRQFPRFTFSRLADGTFSSEMNEYFADQFVARDTLVGIKGYAETAFLKGENNGVLLGRNGQLAVRLFDMYKSRLEQVADSDMFYEDSVRLSLEKYNEYADGEERPLITLFPPRTVDVAVSAFNYPDYPGDRLHDLINDTVSDSGGYIDLLPLMRSSYEDGEYVYYKTDHHWTTRGAYLAYCEIMKKWGLEEQIIPENDFKVEKIPDFYGTTWSRAGLKFVGPDTMEIWSLGNEDDFTTSCYSVTVKKDEEGNQIRVKTPYKTFSGYLNREYLSEKNKYAAFLDGTHNEQTVFSNTEKDRERLLLVKDSFADSLVPFLAQHFDLVIVNLAGNKSDISEYADEYNCDRVLVVYNYENLTGNGNLSGVK